jgi:drug/metabolite transporter (DMT)-like permease
MARSKQLTGSLFVVMSSLGFAIVPTLGVNAYDRGSNAMGVMTPRFTLAALILIVIRQIFARNEGWPTKRHALTMFAIGGFGVTTVSLMYFIAIDRIDTSLAIVLWYGYPVLVLLIAWAVDGKRPTIRVLAPLAITFVGIAITAGQISGGSGAAIALVVGSSVVFAIYLSILSRTSNNMGLLTGAMVLNCGTATGYWVVSMSPFKNLYPIFPSSTNVWLLIVAIAAFGTVVPFLCSLAALKRISAGTYSVVTTVEPVIHIFMGVVFLNELMTINRFFGALLVVTGLTIFTVLDSRNDGGR